MPNSIHVQLADAVVLELNDAGRSWQTPTAEFTATRTWKPWYDYDDLESLKVAVVPLTIETTRLARGGSKMLYDFVIGVDFQRAENVNATDFNTRCDALDKLVQDVADFYQDGHAVVTGYNVLIAQRPETYFEEVLASDQTWETIIMLAIKAPR